MAEFNRSDIRELANDIANYCKEDFSDIFLSGNLRDTIIVQRISNKNFQVEIPAQVYDLTLFKKKGIIVYGGGVHKKNTRYKTLSHIGSYAVEVNDETGGFSGKHKGFVDRAIDKAIDEFKMKQRSKGFKVEVK